MVQTVVYMAGVLGGYALLVRPDEWESAWETLRSTWFRRSKD